MSNPNVNININVNVNETKHNASFEHDRYKVYNSCSNFRCVDALIGDFLADKKKFYSKIDNS